MFQRTMIKEGTRIIKEEISVNPALANLFFITLMRTP